MPRRPVAQLAFPELTTTARTRPPAETSARRPISTGAATTRFCVNRAAALAPSTASASARSGRPLTLMPAATAANENPVGRRTLSGERRSEIMPVSSCLYLQPVFRRRENRESGRLPADHRHFVAAIQPWALVTVLVNLIRKILVIGERETHAPKEFRNSREQAHATDLMFLGLRQQRLDQSPSPAPTLALGIDGDGTNLGQVYAIKMKRAASNDAPILLKHDKVADVLADLGQRARQQRAVARVGRDQRVNLLGVGKNRFTRAHQPLSRAASRRTSFSFGLILHVFAAPRPEP